MYDVPSIGAPASFAACLPRRLLRPQAPATRALGVLVVLAGSAVVGATLASGSLLRVGLLVSVVILMLGIWAVQPTALAFFLVFWVVVLGTLRRLVSYKLGGSPTGVDVLLVVEPVAVVLLVIGARSTPASRTATPLSRAVLVLTALICFGAVNPIQGSARAGMVALMFFVPVAAFWFGRTVGDTTLRHVLATVAFLGLPAALYGLWQLVYGFPSWDSAWIAQQGYQALNVGGAIRQFGSFSSASEYVAFLAIGVVLWMWLQPGRLVLPLRIVAACLLGAAVFYESSRGIVFAAVAATGLVICARLGMRLPTAAAVAATTVFLLPFVVSHIAPASGGAANSSGSAALAAHQVDGLSDPTSASTLPAHFHLVVEGFHAAIAHPIGQGISLVTNAGSKFGEVTQGTEADPSNMGVALGLPGLLVYLVIVWYAFTRAYRLAARRRDSLSLAVLGLLTVTFLQWLNGGQYAVSLLPWLALGWVDSRSLRRDGEPANAAVDE